MRDPTRIFNSGTRDIEPRQAFYHPELDVLRFVAFLAVFFHHAVPGEASLYINAGLSPAVTQWLLAAKEAGAYGVDLFFALSSYLITELLVREYADRGRFSLSAFYIRRALRIWPLYFTFLAATVLIIPIILPNEQFGPVYIGSFALFIGNWVCGIYGLPFSVASPLWSVSVEEQFYIGWPLLLLLFGIKHIKQLAVALLAVALVTRILLAAIGVEHPAVWCNTLARLDPIALGAILAFSLSGRAPQIKNVLRLLICVVALASFLLVGKYLHQAGPTSIITYSVTAVASMMLLVAVLRTHAGLLRFPPFSWLVYLGRISYGLYVFHLFALAVAAKFLFVPLLGIPLNVERRTALAFLLTVMLAAISYKWLEQPFLKLKKRFTYTTTRERGESVSSSGRDVESSVPGLARAG